MSTMIYPRCTTCGQPVQDWGMHRCGFGGVMPPPPQTWSETAIRAIIRDEIKGLGVQQLAVPPTEKP